MRITKYEHAALAVESDGQTIVIDPGSFTRPLTDLGEVVAVVVTHEHPDHWTPDHLQRLLAENPGIPVFAPQGVADAASDVDVTVVSPGETVEFDPFTLRFFGGTHAVIHESVPTVDNVGVLVNDVFYYPGDSYAIPGGVDVTLLAAPAGAPWLKIGDAMDFVLAVSPREVFGTHDMTLSDAGLGMHRARLKWAVEEGGGRFLALDPGDATEI